MKRGKPPHRPTGKSRREVLEMAGLGLTQQQISAVKGISVPTLTKYYAIELETGETALNAAVARNLYRIATSEKANAVTAAIFWMKTRAKWRGTSQLEVGRVGGFDHMTDEELYALLREESKIILESEPPMKLMEGKKQRSFTK
jgi:hypothetical protein